jgi:hypothetical protein
MKQILTKQTAQFGVEAAASRPQIKIASLGYLT